MARARGTTLWTLLFHNGDLMSLRAPHDERMILPLFDSPYKCDMFIYFNRLEQHFTSSPLYPKLLYQLALYAEEIGFTAWTLNPPLTNDRPAETAPLDTLLDQVEDKLGIT